MNLKFGDICVVNFDPAFGSEIQKIRPALVVQERKLASNLVLVMPISSKLDKAAKYDLVVKKDNKNKLFADSVIKVGQLSSFDPGRFIKKIGELDANLGFKVKDYLRKRLGL